MAIIYLALAGLATLYAGTRLVYEAISAYLASSLGAPHTVGILSTLIPVGAFLLHKWKKLSPITFGLSEVMVATGLNWFNLAKGLALTSQQRLEKLIVLVGCLYVAKRGIDSVVDGFKASSKTKGDHAQANSASAG